MKYWKIYLICAFLLIACGGHTAANAQDTPSPNGFYVYERFDIDGMRCMRIGRTDLVDKWIGVTCDWHTWYGE